MEGRERRVVRRLQLLLSPLQLLLARAEQLLLPCRYAASQLVALRTRLHRLRRERNQRHSVAISGTRLGRDRLRLMLLATRLMRRGSRRIELARNVSSASEPAA